MTYTLIDSVTLASSASSVTFSSIDQSYGDLVLVINAFAGADSIGASLRFNSDTGSSYSWVRMSANGTSTFSDAASSSTSIPAYAYSTPDPGESGMWIINVMDYSAIDKHKSVILRAASVDGTDTIAGRWASTSAITAVEFFVSNPNALGIGTTLFLYGIAKAL